MDNNNFVQQGWQCPICKRIYSPTTTMCYYCNQDTTITTTSTDTGTRITGIQYIHMRDTLRDTLIRDNLGPDGTLDQYIKNEQTPLSEEKVKAMMEFMESCDNEESDNGRI